MISKDDENWKKDLNQLLVNGMVYPNRTDYASIGYYYDKVAPKYLYKFYAGSERNVETVFNNKMWYSAPICFNDPYDCDFTIDKRATINSLLVSIAQENNMKKGSAAWKEAHIVLEKEFPNLSKTIDNLKSSMGVACLSENYDTGLMWSHYANNHKGICVEYNLMDFNRLLRFTPIPVIYSKEKSVLRRLRYRYVDYDITSFYIKSLVYKEESWKYENEWRIIREDKACGEQWNDEKHGALLDSVRPVSVILGCNAEPEFEEKIKTNCKSQGIRVYKMVKGTSDYGMSRVEL